MTGVAISSQISVGNILTLSAFVLGAIAVYFRLRSIPREKLEESANFWREQVQPLKDVVEEQRQRIEDVSIQRDEQRATKHRVMGELNAEKMKTDLTSVMKQLAESHAAILNRVELAEKAMLGSMEVQVESQKATTEVLQGLLRGVADLNKVIGKNGNPS